CGELVVDRGRRRACAAMESGRVAHRTRIWREGSRARGTPARGDLLALCILYDRVVAYDEDLAERIRELLIDEPGVTETRMVGGLGFLVGGHLAIAASRDGGVLVRVDPSTSDDVVARTAARKAVMKGRPMDGWLRVDADNLRTKRQLATWVSRSAGYARS